MVETPKKAEVFWGQLNFLFEGTLFLLPAPRWHQMLVRLAPIFLAAGSANLLFHDHTNDEIADETHDKDSLHEPNDVLRGLPVLGAQHFPFGARKWSFAGGNCVMIR
jgi:hypothetical protein